MRQVLDILRDIRLLTKSDQEEVLVGINNELNNSEASLAHLIEIRKEVQEQEEFSCPHCQSDSVISHGNYRGRKRYKCKSCKKTFNDLTGTSVAHIHKKEEWQEYLKCIGKSMTLRGAAKHVGVSYRTSFMWRHKIISSFKDIGCTKLEGIIEGDETFFLFSEKGNRNIKNRKARKRGVKAKKAGINNEHVAVIVTSDRINKQPIAEVAGRGRVSTKQIDNTIGRWLDEKASVLCTDSHRSYDGFAKKYNLTHFKINASKGQYVKDKIYHIQNINSAHSLLKDWMKKFSGGVASGYLQNYMNWFRILRSLGNDAEKYILYALTSNQAYLPVKLIKPQQVIS